MKTSSRKIIETTADILNEHLAKQTDVGQALLKGDRGTVTLVNQVLAAVAEGGSLVLATETDGTLLGFVPRSNILGSAPKAPIPAGPDDNE